MKRLLSLVLASFLLLSIAPDFASANSPTSLISTARNYLGTPYLLGGTTPRAFDCSGYTQYVFNKEGVSLPRTTGQQIAVGSPVSKSNLEVGDLVFFNTSGRGVSHVGIYIGSNNFIHASVSKGVMVSSLNDPYYWKSRYMGARRVTEFEPENTNDTTIDKEQEPVKTETQVAVVSPVKEVIYATRAEVAQELADTLGLDQSTVNLTFKDVDESNPHYHAISAVAEANIFSGFQGNFNPNKELTRGQMAKVLVEAFELQGSTPANFTDVPKDHWAFDYINTLYHNKVTSGYGDGKYGLDDKVTIKHLHSFINSITK
ncbi:endopeptidase Spr precursor [Sporosarcina sp. PTS2304]|uniref:C40 family peptidase n=1 Tax=Sporosarcina sp. PTS2304 TaxID=2283194 RepID=UPI000E0DD896|nr:C40 family peptidase [Sporosarcina sp. PTS2304]AXH98366.1 endopeptidase Spr precursor [Sporosarcina sp. PTS2304]